MALPAVVNGSYGVGWRDVSPRTPVWAESPMDTCWRCSWTFRQRGLTREWCRFLLAVHGKCPDHAGLRTSSGFG